METSIETFGSLEYVLDKFSKAWTWKIQGSRAVNMVSRLVPQAWYGENIDEVIIPDNEENVKQIKWILDRYPLEILSKSAWQRKIVKTYSAKPTIPEVKHKLKRAKPGKQFRGKLLNFQKEGLDFLLKSSGNALLADEMGLGKCVVGDSVIETINGPVLIEDLWKKSSIIEQNTDECWARLSIPTTIQTFDGKKIVCKKIERIFRQKIDEPITKIMLHDGSALQCTRRHRFLTPDGWKMAGTLTINDKVAVPAKTLHSGTNHLEPDQAELMAWHMAEGYEYFENDKYVHGRFYNSDPIILSRIRNLAKRQGVRLLDAKKTNTTYVIYTSKLYRLFSQFGYVWGKKSTDKTIPQCILKSSVATQKAFIRAMFDAEGHVGKTHCEFTTTSKAIAYGMRDLLRHFEIWLRIRVAMKSATNGTKIKRYYVCTFGGNSITRFYSQFRLLTARKQSALESLAKKYHNTNIGGIPSQKIIQKLSDRKISLRSLNLSSAYKHSRGMSKELACLVVHKLQSTNNHDLAIPLDRLATSSIHWCPIKAIETKKYHEYVYDLSVPKTHNYIVNGIISHNTVQTLSYLTAEKQSFPVLVVAPLVTLNNWQREITKFLKKKSRNGRIVENDTPTSTIIRTGKSEDLGKYDFYIINYELLYKRQKDLSKLNIKTVVCDEVHNLRSKTTQKYKAIKKLASLPSIRYRIGLSGTPIYNRGSEIWPIVDILRPGLLGNFKEFCEYFCYVNEKGKAIVLENKRASLRNELQKHVMLRRKKSDVLKELKDKVRYKEVIDSDTEYYFGELDKIWNKLEEEQKTAESNFDKSASYRRAIQSERQAAGIAKLPHVINFVKNIMEIEESVVVFCHHKVIHKLLNENLQEFSPVSIIGGQSDKLRQDQIDKFQNGQSKLMIAGLRAGNVGINLNRAKYVIFAELDWSPAIHRQAEDRLHRIGQKGIVFAYYLIGNGTLDDHVANVLVDKSYEIDTILDEKHENHENKEKAEMILAQIHDKIRTK